MLPGNTRVIACKVFRDELEYLGIPEEECLFMDQDLHRYPSELNKKLSETIRSVEQDYSPARIILVYGYCGGALENLSTERARLVLARAPDCIPLLLGRDPERIDPEGKGVYYVSRGWIAYSKYPYIEYLGLKDRFGHEDAYWSCKELLRSYSRVISIQSIPDSSLDWRQKAEEFALFFHMQYGETRGDTRFLERLLRGHPAENVFEMMPGQTLSRKDFETHG